MNDYSFIRLEQTFEKAKNIGDSPIATIFYSDSIQLLPDEIYVQKTDTTLGISFDGNYQVLVVDCKGTELADITNKVAIEQFTDANGLPQIKYELYKIGVDFYKENVHLKFIHTVSSAVWYSNPIIISDYQNEFVTRFDYMNYDGSNLMLSIGLRCWFETNDFESSSKEYTTINGNKVTSRLILTEFEKYKFDRVDNFTYRRLNKMLTNSIIYVNGYRMTNKVVTASKERQGDSNVFPLDFKIAIDYNESFVNSYQVFEPLNYQLYPIDNGIYTVTIPQPFLITFNRNVSITDNTLRAHLYRNGVFVETSVITNLTNVLSTSFGFAFDTADYYILVDSNKVISSFGEVWQGITLPTEWNFSIVPAPAFYNPTFYNPTFYNT